MVDILVDILVEIQVLELVYIVVEVLGLVYIVVVVREQEQVYIEMDQEQEQELDKVAALAQDMVEEQVHTIKKNKEKKCIVIYSLYYS